MFKTINQLLGGRHVSRAQWAALYRLNHIEKTFRIDFGTFLEDPWAYLGRPSPEIQALWDRPYSLLPKQLECLARESTPVASFGSGPNTAPRRRNDWGRKQVGR